jgi:hypothetical protein
MQYAGSVILNHFNKPRLTYFNAGVISFLCLEPLLETGEIYRTLLRKNADNRDREVNEIKNEFSIPYTINYFPAHIHRDVRR